MPLLTLAAVCLSALMFGLEISSVPVILPTLERVLHADFRQVQWVMNAYTIACTTVLMATGTLADRFGRRRMFAVSTVAFGVTSLACGLVRNTPLLIASRFLQGMSGGAMLICQIAVLSHQFQDPMERGRAFGMWGIVFGIGLGFGPIVGGAIVALASWPWVFLVHVPLAAVNGLAIAHAVTESRDPEARTLDTIGIVTLSLATLCVATYLTQGPDLGFGSPTAWGLITVGVLSAAAFVIAEMRAVRPMFDFSVFRIRNFSGAIMGSMGMNFSFWPFMIYLPIYFQSGLGYDSVHAGWSLLAYTLPTVVFPPLGERLSLRYAPRFVIPSGLFTIGLGFSFMLLGSRAGHPSWLTMLPGCLLAGIGLAVTNTPVTNTTTGSVSSTRAGMASGIDMSARLISLAINIALMGSLLVSGVAMHLAASLGSGDGRRVHALALSLVAGEAVTSLGSDPGLAHAALTHGFAIVMLYGALGAGVLGLASLWLFGSKQ
ncbi:MAG TPA: MFS transporter [Gemmatimonadaceae bacterium]|nr:MFS transporter [Gemmatimonadaceae bacterium]